ncbi:porin [Aquincola sp. S2]|uniref:Porin n=1 Tax=Pseudaquabacterium terrae TaxID=2732868 RepID=A0ABX2EL63_9BURK|nr:porin [Aquabacterium terrae]NRF69396.1 porin [Aquabacterium terrae]
MKRTAILGRAIVAALATLAGVSAVQAQSSVTAYGRLNLTVERQKNAAGATSTVLQNNSSRIGFKGTEDLGGGLKAGFQLEHGFAADTGVAAATFWGRQSEVNLGGNFGTVRLGNFTSEAYYATADYISNHNHDTGTSSDAFYAYVGRNANKIAYRLPSMGGFTLEGAVSLHESQVSGGRPLKNSFDLAANYDAGPLHLGAGYEKNDQQNQFAVRVFYELGDFGLGAYVQRDENGYAAGNRTTTRLTAMYTLGGLTEFHLNWGHAGNYSKVAGDSSANQGTVGINYKLSKRTKVYGFYTKVDDKGRIYGDFSSLAVGLRHNF